MRYVYVTDLHVRGRAPRRRLDEWPATPLGKVRQVVELAKAHRAEVLCGGDVFDGPRPSIDVLAGFIAAAEGVEWSVVVGNHDEVGHQVTTYKSGALGILERLPWFNVLGGVDGEPFDMGEAVLRGFHYHHGIDGRAEFLVAPDNHEAIKVAIPHTMIVPDERPYPHVLREDVVTDAHLVLCSHSHGGWPAWCRDDGVWFIHPGAMSRMAIDDSKRTPAVYLLDLGADPLAISRIELEAAGAEVFDYSTAETARTWDQRIGDFLTRMEEGVDSGMDLTWRLDKLAKETDLEPEVLDEIRTRLCLLEAEADS